MACMSLPNSVWGNTTPYCMALSPPIHAADAHGVYMYRQKCNLCALVLMTEGRSHAVMAARLAVLYGPVIPQWGIEHLVHRRIPPDRVFVELNTEPRAPRHDQIALLQLEWLFE